MDVVAVFMRRQAFESYLNSLRTKMRGQDQSEFSDYSILERNYLEIVNRFRKFSEELQKDYPNYMNRIKQKMQGLLDQTISYFV